MTLAELAKEVGLSEYTLSRNFPHYKEKLEQKGISICKVSKNEFKISKQKFPDIIEIPRSILSMTKYDAAANLCARNKVTVVERAIEELGWQDTKRIREGLKEGFKHIIEDPDEEVLMMSTIYYKYWSKVSSREGVPWEDFIKVLLVMKLEFAEEGGEFYSTNRLLCDEAGLSERRLVRAKNVLEKKGLFEKKRNYEVWRGKVRARPTTYTENRLLG